MNGVAGPYDFAIALTQNNCRVAALVALHPDQRFRWRCKNGSLRVDDDVTVNRLQRWKQIRNVPVPPRFCAERQGCTAGQPAVVVIYKNCCRWNRIVSGIDDEERRV